MNSQYKIVVVMVSSVLVLLAAGLGDIFAASSGVSVEQKYTEVENRELSEGARARDPHYRSPASCSGIDLAVVHVEYTSQGFAQATVENRCSDKTIRGTVIIYPAGDRSRGAWKSISVPGHGTALSGLIGSPVSSDGRITACVSVAGDIKSSNNCMTKRVR